MKIVPARKVLNVVFLAGLSLAAAVVPAQAFEIFGFKFGEDADTAQVEVIDPLAYEVTFDIASDSSAMRSGLRQSTSLWTGRDTPASGSAGLISSAQGDYRALLAALYARGHYSGAISIRINGQEASSLPLTQTLSVPALVEVRIDPGPQFKFGRTDFINPAPRHSVPLETPAQDRFVLGAPARADVVDAAGEEEVTDFRYAGYPKARVAEREVIADHRQNVLDVTIRMDPGRAARFGAVGVGQTGGIDPEFIRYMADIPEGAPFNPAAIERAVSRLNRLRVFRAVRVEEAETINPDGTLPLTIETVPRKARRFGVGATLSSIEGIGVEGYWLHRQIGDRAERLRFSGSVAGIGAESNPENYDYALGVRFTRPGTFDPDNDLVLEANVKQEVFETYLERTLDGSVGLTRRFNDRLEGSVAFALAYSEIEDDFGKERFLISSLPVELTYDKRDNVLDPTTGYYISGELRPFYEVEFETLALRAEIEGRTYFELVEDRTVIALRAAYGGLFGEDLGNAPASLKFFTGGGGSVRGYAYRSIGLDLNGDTIGGESKVEGSVELRQRFGNSFGVTVFADAGLVSASAFPDGDTDLQIGAGAGIRYYSGLGPLRLDLATPIDPRDGDPNVAVYIGIGQAF
ncbi:autotransporter assembly complex protein TamA [Oceanibium sediminis]|uniref:autotransporter assembly complex protein TamA n=1 Tax=Oceanibium sediminis TaxID=2026339 RepID=UPI000DD38EE9|nr:autotransporter assembly complex family protein [Oceanibium sediminis]